MEKVSGYHQFFLSETAMYRYKQLISPKLNLRDYCFQVGEALAEVKAMNKVGSIAAVYTFVGRVV